MGKIIKISDIECRLKSSAAIPRMYRMKFGRDLFVDMEKIMTKMKENERINEARIEAAREEAEEKGVDFNEGSVEKISEIPVHMLEMFENIAYMMHKHGDPDQPREIDEWLEQFEIFDIYEIMPEIIEMWNRETKQTSKVKKKSGK